MLLSASTSAHSLYDETMEVGPYSHSMTADIMTPNERKSPVQSTLNLERVFGTSLPSGSMQPSNARPRALPTRPDTLPPATSVQRPPGMTSVECLGSLPRYVPPISIPSTSNCTEFDNDIPSPIRRARLVRKSNSFSGFDAPTSKTSIPQDRPYGPRRLPPLPVCPSCIPSSPYSPYSSRPSSPLSSPPSSPPLLYHSSPPYPHTSSHTSPSRSPRRLPLTPPEITARKRETPYLPSWDTASFLSTTSSQSSASTELSSPTESTTSSMFTLTPSAAEIHRLRVQKMTKLARRLGEMPPLELVFGPSAALEEIEEEPWEEVVVDTQEERVKSAVENPPSDAYHRHRRAASQNPLSLSKSSIARPGMPGCGMRFVREVGSNRWVEEDYQTVVQSLRKL